MPNPRNVECIVCGRMTPIWTAVAAMVGRGLVRTWVCRRCAADPEAGVEDRKRAQARGGSFRDRIEQKAGTP